MVALPASSAEEMLYTAGVSGLAGIGRGKTAGNGSNVSQIISYLANRRIAREVLVALLRPIWKLMLLEKAFSKRVEHNFSIVGL